MCIRRKHCTDPQWERAPLASVTTGTPGIVQTTRKRCPSCVSRHVTSRAADAVQEQALLLDDIKDRENDLEDRGEHMADVAADIADWHAVQRLHDACIEAHERARREPRSRPPDPPGGETLAPMAH
jgi:hypothetical protein